jgi:hypothetical protein
MLPLTGMPEMQDATLRKLANDVAVASQVAILLDFLLGKALKRQGVMIRWSAILRSCGELLH